MTKQRAEPASLAPTPAPEQPAHDPANAPPAAELAGQGARAVPPPRSPSAILALQQAVGNRAVQRMLARQRPPARPRATQDPPRHAHPFATRPALFFKRGAPPRAATLQRAPTLKADGSGEYEDAACAPGQTLIKVSGNKYLIKGTTTHVFWNERDQLYTREDGKQHPFPGADRQVDARPRPQPPAAASGSTAAAAAAAAAATPPPAADRKAEARARPRRRRAEDDDADDEKRGARQPRKHARSFAAEVAARLVALGWTKYGAGQAMVLFKLTPASRAQPLKGRKKINTIHRHTANVVAQKSYRHLRTKQALRWASTIAFRRLNDDKKDPREIQSSLQRGSFYMASNTSKGNKELVRQAQGRTGLAMLSGMHRSLSDHKGDLSARERRHARKFKKRIMSAQEPDAYAAVRAALARPIVICVRGKNGLHAERRIALELGVRHLRPGDVGGVKRPCSACYVKLYLGQDIHPGPYWPSAASNIDFDNYTDQNVNALAAEINQLGNTYVSLSGGGVTHEYDTDSDTDTESDDDDEVAIDDKSDAGAGGDAKRLDDDDDDGGDDVIDYDVEDDDALDAEDEKGGWLPSRPPLMPPLDEKGGLWTPSLMPPLPMLFPGMLPLYPPLFPPYLPYPIYPGAFLPFPPLLYPPHGAFMSPPPLSGLSSPQPLSAHASAAAAAQPGAELKHLSISPLLSHSPATGGPPPPPSSPPSLAQALLLSSAAAAAQPSAELKHLSISPLLSHSPATGGPPPPPLSQALLSGMASGLSGALPPIVPPLMSHGADLKLAAPPRPAPTGPSERQPPPPSVALLSVTPTVSSGTPPPLPGSSSSAQTGVSTGVTALHAGLASLGLLPNLPPLPQPPPSAASAAQHGADLKQSVILPATPHSSATGGPPPPPLPSLAQALLLSSMAAGLSGAPPPPPSAASAAQQRQDVKQALPPTLAPPGPAPLPRIVLPSNPSALKKGADQKHLSLEDQIVAAVARETIMSNPGVRQLQTEGFTIGEASQDGMNCLITSILQAAGRGHSPSEVSAVREALIAQGLARRGELLDPTTAAGAAVRAYMARTYGNFTLVVIQISPHTGSRNDTRLLIGTGGNEIYIMHLGAHFSPLTKR